MAGCGTPTASTSSNEVESAASNNEREYIEADVTNEGAVSEESDVIVEEAETKSRRIPIANFVGWMISAIK